MVATILPPAVMKTTVQAPNRLDSTLTIGQGPSGPPGPPGDGSGGTGLPSEFAINNVSEYTVTHSLPYAPSIWLLDTAGRLVFTDVIYTATQVTLVFPSPFTGTLFVK